MAFSHDIPSGTRNYPIGYEAISGAADTLSTTGKTTFSASRSYDIGYPGRGEGTSTGKSTNLKSFDSASRTIEWQSYKETDNYSQRLVSSSSQSANFSQSNSENKYTQSLAGGTSKGEGGSVHVYKSTIQSESSSYTFTASGENNRGTGSGSYSKMIKKVRKNSRTIDITRKTLASYKAGNTVTKTTHDEDGNTGISVEYGSGTTTENNQTINAGSTSLGDISLVFQSSFKKDKFEQKIVKYGP